MRRGGGVGLSSSSSTGGEIIQVQGGHIIRATGRKDRHSKVYTAKGPRDRRVRLAAHTAIQFYDVQDRLGYDRPSKAVDWLINKAKDAIDRLDRLPPFDPASSDSRVRNFHAGLLQVAVNQFPSNSLDVGPSETADLEMVAGGGGGRRRDGGDQSHESSIGYHHLLPHQICLDDSQSIVGETMRSFFPGATNQEDEQMNSIGGYHHHHHLFYPKAVQPHHQQVQHHQDLGLSLQTFHNDPEGNPTAAPTPQTGFQQAGFQVTTTTTVPHGGSIATTAGDDTWPDNINQLHHNHQLSLPLQNDMGRFSRLMAWTGGFGDSLPGQGIVIGSGNLPSPPPVLLGERFNHHHQQQQPSSSIRAWEDLPLPLGFRDINHHNQTSIEIGVSHTNSPRTSNDTGFVTGFCIPPGTTQSHHHQEHGNRIGTSAHNNSSSMSKDTNH